MKDGWFFVLIIVCALGADMTQQISDLKKSCTIDATVREWAIEKIREKQ